MKYLGKTYEQPSKNLPKASPEPPKNLPETSPKLPETRSSYKKARTYDHRIGK